MCVCALLPRMRNDNMFEMTAVMQFPQHATCLHCMFPHPKQPLSLWCAGFSDGPFLSGFGSPVQNMLASTLPCNLHSKEHNEMCMKATPSRPDASAVTRYPALQRTCFHANGLSSDRALGNSWQRLGVGRAECNSVLPGLWPSVSTVPANLPRLPWANQPDRQRQHQLTMLTPGHIPL